MPVLASNLARSPDISSGRVPLTPLAENTSLPARYARAMETADADLLVFAHSDVYLPAGWFDRLLAQIERLEAMDPNWAMVTPIGRTKSGDWVGRVWDSSLRRVIGEPVPAPVRIITSDELALVVRRAAGVSFDKDMPTDIHLFATDFVLEAARQDKACYCLDLPLVHNSKPVLQYAPAYVSAYKYLIRKWRSELPVPTTTVTLTRNPFELLFRRLRVRYKAMFRGSTYFVDRLNDPRAKAIELGFEAG